MACLEHSRILMFFQPHRSPYVEPVTTSSRPSHAQKLLESSLTRKFRTLPTMPCTLSPVIPCPTPLCPQFRAFAVSADSPKNPEAPLCKSVSHSLVSEGSLRLCGHASLSPPRICLSLLLPGPSGHSRAGRALPKAWPSYLQLFLQGGSCLHHTPSVPALCLP